MAMLPFNRLADKKIQKFKYLCLVFSSVARWHMNDTYSYSAKVVAAEENM